MNESAMTPAGIPDRLVRDDAGIWTAPSRPALSYPDDGHAECFLLEERSFWFAHRNRCILAAVRRHAPAGPILDIGGGNGCVTRALIDAGFPAVLLEPGPTGAFNAKTHRRIPDVICAALGDAGFPAGSIAAAGLFDVLEHIEDDRGFLEEIHGTLKPGGLLYITVPAFGALWSASDRRAGHFRRYSPRQLAERLSERYELVFSTLFFGVLAPPIWALRALPWRLGFRRDDSLPAARREHGLDGGFRVRCLNRLLRREVRRIEAGRPMRWGASCLCVARKPSS